MESFDVTSLYTNLYNMDALQAIFELLNEHREHVNLYGFNVPQIITTLKECLDCTMVENLNHVRCALVSDCEKLGLLEMATTSAHHDDEGKLVEARLTLNMKEPRRKTSEDTYVMEVVEVTHP
ncbi:hypothetical protein Y032_0211g2211 [Ancylostoma ceylanicum]|uniref:Uncharacterized protein n=1 Tax=Ancylostoma ceylanicum TaxID=53326 RepID=A0A016SL63_9BILA|nr:hypothetical protein Y032_0211g2211 [Ancylostoma ceylanicum]